ncbi:Uncharacterised protein [Mycobacterium tuberculosis]|nr:Uncharacterised protein [Mycobacterium tuberculosis]
MATNGASGSTPCSSRKRRSLEHHRHGVATGTAFDDPHLPQRAVTVQRQPGDVPTDLGQLATPSGRGHSDPAQVVPDLKIVVVHPHGVIQVKLGIGELHPKFGRRLDILLQRGMKPAVRVAARHRRGVQLQDAAHVQRLRRCLHIEEESIESA